MNTATKNQQLRDYCIGRWQVESLNEAKAPLPEGILARVIGPIALMDGVSLNNRYYSTELWENCIADVTPRFSDGGVWGTVGHDVPFDENTLKTGEITHKIVNIWPDHEKKLVMAEIHILDNEIGTHINRYMRQGMKIAVSTRAYGEIRERGRGPNGSDIVESRTFHLVGVDWVMSPGVPIAYPAVVESIFEELNKEYSMSGEQGHESKILVSLNERLINEKTELTVELKTVAAENKQLNEQLQTANQKLAAIEEKLGKNPIDLIDQINEGLRKWTSLEPFKSLADKTGLHKQGGGSAASFISESFKVLEGYTKHGSVESVDESMSKLAKYAEFGPVADVEAGYDLLESYRKTELKPKEIKALQEKCEKMLSIFENTKRMIAARKIAKKFAVNQDTEDGQNQYKALVESAFQLLKNGLSAEATIKTIKATNNLKLNESAPPPKGGVVLPTERRNTNSSSVTSIWESMRPVDPEAEAARKRNLPTNRLRK